MDQEFQLDLPLIRASGLGIRLGKGFATGSLLQLKGHQGIAKGLSDLPKLARYAEVEIVAMNGAPSLFIPTAFLLLFPQVFVGYHKNGCPLLIGATEAMKGHVMLLGPTQAGKSSMLASMVYQLIRLGYFVAGVSLKDTDPSLVGSMKAAADSLTRLDKDGKLHPAHFSFFSLKAGEYSEGFNALAQQQHEQPVWMRVGEMLVALGFGDTDGDPARAYFTNSAQTLLQSLKDWGGSFRELNEKIAALKLDHDTLYSTAGVRNVIAQQAAIEQANLPEGHPLNIPLADLILQRGAVYMSACYQDAGAVASSVAGLFVKALISAKRTVCPDRSKKIFVFIDESQIFHQALLKQLIEQAASNGVVLIIVQHTLSQFGEDDWETLSMTQCRLIFGAVPGASTDRHLQQLFGTKRDYLFSFNRSHSSSKTYTFTDSSGPTGDSVSVSSSDATSRQAGFSLNEREIPAWSSNDTLALNYDRDLFVLQVNPGAEYAQFGPRAILCKRGGSHLSYDEINRVTREVLANTENKMLPGASKPKLLGTGLSPRDQARRRECLDQLRKTAELIREAIG